MFYDTGMNHVVTYGVPYLVQGRIVTLVEPGTNPVSEKKSQQPPITPWLQARNTSFPGNNTEFMA